MLASSILFLVGLVFALGDASSEAVHRSYRLEWNTTSFAVLVVPREDAKSWIFCLNYATDSESDPAMPGRLPKACEYFDSFYSGFVAFRAEYSSEEGQFLNLTVTHSTIDAEFELARNVSVGQGNAIVLDFVLTDKSPYVTLRGSFDSRVYIPHFEIPDFHEYAIVDLSTNDTGFRQITPSLPRNDSEPRGHRIKYKPKSELEVDSLVNDTRWYDNVKVSHAKNQNEEESLVTRAPTIIDHLLRESMDILPNTVRRSAMEVRSSSAPPIVRVGNGGERSAALTSTTRMTLIAMENLDVNETERWQDISTKTSSLTTRMHSSAHRTSTPASKQPKRHVSSSTRIPSTDRPTTKFWPAELTSHRTKSLVTRSTASTTNAIFSPKTESTLEPTSRLVPRRATTSTNVQSDHSSTFSHPKSTVSTFVSNPTATQPTSQSPKTSEPPTQQPSRTEPETDKSTPIISSTSHSTKATSHSTYNSSNPAAHISSDDKNVSIPRNTSLPPTPKSSTNSSPESETTSRQTQTTTSLSTRTTPVLTTAPEKVLDTESTSTSTLPSSTIQSSTQPITTATSTHLSSTISTPQPTTPATSTRPITSTQTLSSHHHRRKLNEEEALWELLLRPRPGSRIEVIGREESNAEVEPSELLMFEIAARGASPKPFVPTFMPFFDPVTKPPSPSNATSDKPCAGHGGILPYFPFNPMGQGPMGQPPAAMQIPQFGPFNPFPQQGMMGGGFGR